MKKIVFLTLLFICAGVTSQAQKMGYVDIKLILESMDEYKTVKAKIDQISAKWQKELEEKYAAIEKMYADFAAEEVLLPEETAKQRKEAIWEAERLAKEFKKEKFGYDGELYKLQDREIQPIQDRIYEAVEKVAQEKKLDFIFDKSANAGLIFTNGLFDRTEDVMAKLGISR